MRLVLGSSSPRRLEIMRYFNLPFTQDKPPFDESLVPYAGDPKSYVTTLALEKAHSLKPKHPDAIILTADTTVVFDNKVFNKPTDRAHAIEMLSQLAGNWHSVCTAVAISSPTITLTEVEETRVLMNTLSPYEIERYIDIVRPTDKAGAYAIQQTGSLIIKEIQGCYYNVVGLPINSVQRLLHAAGIDLWDHI